VASDRGTGEQDLTDASVIIVVADGLGPAALDDALARGDVPALASLRDAGGRFDVTTVFPSVTGVGYIPMLTGRFPGAVGVPGLRWYDRSRGLPWWLGHARSYVGPQLRRIDDDLAGSVRTIPELVGERSLGMQAVITRGIPRHRQLERGARIAAHVVHAHLAGDPDAWAGMEQRLAERFVDRVRRDRLRFGFAAFLAGDKAAHANGPDSPGARRSLHLVDQVVGRLREDAERDGRWPAMHLWVVSDHGHSRVAGHHDLADVLRDAGLKVRSHPWTLPDRSDVAVMVSGNSMAHVYLELASPARLPWPVLKPRWEARLQPALDHDAIDLVAVWRGTSEVEVWRRGHGSAVIASRDGAYSYRPLDGDPLGVDAFEGVGALEAHERTRDSSYPDAVVQLAALVPSDRAGDVTISAAPGWDLRRRYEPVEHASSHGGLHRAHMEVPLIVGCRPVVTPRRTVDLFPSVLQALGIRRPDRLDGTGFLQVDASD